MDMSAPRPSRLACWTLASACWPEVPCTKNCSVVVVVDLPLMIDVDVDVDDLHRHLFLRASVLALSSEDFY